MKSELARLESRIPSCRKCPRLVKTLTAIKKENPDHWCRPVPGFGDPNAKIMLVGLAPGRRGGNITGRFFTGDASGDFLWPRLRKAGFVKKEDEFGPYDFSGLFVSAALRCFPPGNKPEPNELDNCRPYLEQEIKLLKNLNVIICLGKIAHDAVVKIMQKRRGGAPREALFRHGLVDEFFERPRFVICSYHVSPQNTYTGKLTPEMFDEILRTAKKLAK